MRQIEVSRTIVFDQPRNGRLFFEALVADNLDLGRPEQVELIFGRKILPSTPGVFATRVVTRGVDVTVNVGYKHSRSKGVLQGRPRAADRDGRQRPDRSGGAAPPRASARTPSEGP